MVIHPKLVMEKKMKQRNDGVSSLRNIFVGLIWCQNWYMWLWRYINDMGKKGTNEIILQELHTYTEKKIYWRYSRICPDKLTFFLWEKTHKNKKECPHLSYISLFLRIFHKNIPRTITTFSTSSSNYQNHQFHSRTIQNPPISSQT